MAIQTSLTYSDGDILDVDGHNENVYKATGLNHGILSTVNGRLASSNLNSSFAFNAEHVMPGEVFRAHQEFQYETVDYFGDVNSDQTYTNFVNVGGGAIKVYLPYAVSLALWQCSFFCSFWIPAIDKIDGVNRSEPSLYVQLAYDGSRVGHTMRKLPMSLYSNESGVVRDTYEHYLARPYDMSHMVQNLSAGWHDFQLKLYIENVSEVFDMMAARGGFEGDLDTAQEVYPRASFGIRNARVLTIL